MVVDVTDDGLQVYIRLPDIVINTDGRAKFQTETIQLTGSIRARMSAVASMRVEKSGSDASVDASVGRVEVSIDALEPGFGSKRANALFELADGIVRNELETRLKEAVRKEFVGTLPTLITEAFSSLQSTLDGRTFSFDSKIAGERKIQVDGSIATLTSARRRSLRSKLKAELATFGDVAHPNSPGVPLTSDEPRSDAPLFARGRLQVGVRLALLNGLLNELWTAGLLELDLSKSDAVPAAVQNAQLSGKLPPVLRPSRRAEPGDLTLEVGHIVLETKLLEQTDTYGVSIRAGLDVGLADGKLEMAIAGEPKLTTWVIATTGEDGALFTPDKLRSLIRSQVLSQLKTAIDKGLSINLPAPDVSGLSSIAPTLSGLKLSFDPERPPALREGWLLFDTRLTGKLGSKSGGN
ncbi:MAG: hypothetical protein ABEL76_00390 [Bradymonadaceae bacterium]